MFNDKICTYNNDYDKIYTLKDCARELDLYILQTTFESTASYASLIADVAAKQNRNDIVEQLEFAGLIYG